MDAKAAPDVYDDEPWELAAAYRVTLWEQPAKPRDIGHPRRGTPNPTARRVPVPVPGGPMGWEEMTFELAGAQDVREVIQWAETALSSGGGPASRRGVLVHDSEYVIYAKAQGEDRWLHVAGWTPVLASDVSSNLRRLK